MSNLTDFIGGGGIKSIQRGVGTGDITISAVDINKSVVVISNASSNNYVQYSSNYYTVYGYTHVAGGQLTTSTNLHISGSAAACYWQVIEYK